MLEIPAVVVEAMIVAMAVDAGVVAGEVETIATWWWISEW